MTREAKIVVYDAPYEESHREFARSMWPGKRRRADPGYVRWKFRGPAAGAVSGLLLAVDDGVVLGQLGLVPTRLSGPDGTRDVQWACDLMVDPAARGRRIASSLFRSALERDALVLGSDASAGADAVMTKLGFKEVLGPWRMLFPSRPAAVARLVARGRSGLLGPLLRAVLPFALGAFKTATPRSGDRTHRCQQWRSAADTLAAATPSGGWTGIDHDREFFEWRFQYPEGFHRDVVGIDDGRGGAALLEPSPDQSSLSDWTADNRAAGARVIGEAAAAAAEVGSGWIRAYAQTTRERRMLVSLGFVPRRSRVRILVDPRSPAHLMRARWRYTYCDSDENI